MDANVVSQLAGFSIFQGNTSNKSPKHKDGSYTSATTIKRTPVSPHWS